MSLPTTPNQPTATAYTRLCEHHAKHVYKRGQNKGDAPLEDRRKTARLVRITPAHADVILYRTTVLRAYPDGSVAITTGGYNTNSPREVLNQALRFLTPYGGVYSTKRFGVSQMHYVTPFHVYAFYDGMILQPDGTPYAPRPFKRRLIDPTKSKPFAAAVREFRQTFPILHAALPNTANAQQIQDAARDLNLYDTRNLHEALTSRPDTWPAIVALNAYQTVWVGGWREVKQPPSSTLSKILSHVKQTMYMIVDADVCAIPRSAA